MTIEERAQEYLDRPAKAESYHREIEQAYIDGATEQEKITIDKACEFFFEYFVEKHGAMSGQGCDAFCWDFRKAMEK